MDFLKNIPVSLWLFTLFPIVSFILISSSIIPIYFPNDGVFGVALTLTENYKLQLLGAAVCFITTCAWICLVGMFIAQYRHKLIVQ